MSFIFGLFVHLTKGTISSSVQYPLTTLSLSPLKLPIIFSEPLRYSSRYSHANEVAGSGGEAADDAGSLPAIHKSKAAKNNHLLPNGDGGRAPIRIPVPPVTREDDILHLALFLNLLY